MRSALLLVSVAVAVAVAVASPGCDRAGASGDGPAFVSSTPAARVVSTMPSTTEMLHAMGAWDRVVGVSAFCDIPPAARDLPGVGSGMQPDLERILALRPDLVVGTIAQDGFDFVTALDRAGVPVLLVPDRNFAELYEGIAALGRAVGADEGAARTIDGMRAALSELRDRVSGLGPVRVLIAFDHDPIYAAGPSTMVDELVRAAGGVNVVTGGDWVQLDRERVIRLAPEVILEPSRLGRDELLRVWAPLQTVPAVRDGRIYAVQAHAISRPGPGAPDAAWEIARRLYPDQLAAGSQ